MSIGLGGESRAFDMLELLDLDRMVELDWSLNEKEKERMHSWRLVSC